MVNIYSLKRDGDKKLSEHFRVREFRSKDGSDKILIDDDLIATLEKVFFHFNCSKIDVVSGYRTPSHDKAVGGRGRGNHTEGKAADFIAYTKRGVKISSKEVSLYLEDIGIKGIGYRSGGNSKSTHFDVNYREKRWFGDEKNSMTASIGSSFYDYFGIKYSYKTVKASELKIREEPALSAKTLKTVSNGSKILVANTKTVWRDGYRWNRIKIDGIHYWAAGKYLR